MSVKNRDPRENPGARLRQRKS